eukprot:TRINITY_DN1155_c0_g1_i1.p1 TRINITY_DN1155_c0_g1~~TRINITY_DN1155_c0_g1_i1.p1  ORF type:complete len:244 (-),score=65.41 TRINITY_DN1155_c0_g1_i1:10-714(-)
MGIRDRSIIEAYQMEEEKCGVLEDPKDYVFKLIKNLDAAVVASYKAKLAEIKKDEGTMEMIFRRLSESPERTEITHKEIACKRGKPEKESQELKCCNSDFMENPGNLFNQPLKLPEPKITKQIEGITLEEKECLWRMVFFKADINSANSQLVSSCQAMSTHLCYSANSVLHPFIREDELNGFTQFTSEYEAQKRQIPQVPRLQLDNCLGLNRSCLLYTSPSPRDLSTSRMPSSA